MQYPPLAICASSLLLAAGGLFAGVSTGCEDPWPTGRAPQIVAVRPAAAPSGAVITLVGDGFGLRGERDRVWLGGVELAVESWTPTAVLVTLPERAPGVSALVVRAGALVSAPYPFEVIVPPSDAAADATLDAAADRGVFSQ